MKLLKSDLQSFEIAQRKIEINLGFIPKQKKALQKETKNKPEQKKVKKTQNNLTIPALSPKPKTISIKTPQSINSRTAFKINRQRQISPRPSSQLKSPRASPRNQTAYFDSFYNDDTDPLNHPIQQITLQNPTKKINELDYSKLQLRLEYLTRKVQGYRNVPKINRIRTKNLGV